MRELTKLGQLLEATRQPLPEQHEAELPFTAATPASASVTQGDQAAQKISSLVLARAPAKEPACSTSVPPPLGPSFRVLPPEERIFFPDPTPPEEPLQIDLTSVEDVIVIQSSF